MSSGYIRYIRVSKVRGSFEADSDSLLKKRKTKAMYLLIIMFCMCFQLIEIKFGQKYIR